MKLERLTIGDGPPLVYLHGFPDHPPSARPFLERLAKRHGVIAPWLRGYAPSPRTGPYDLGTLADDVIGLIDDANLGAVDLVGHDWGAAIAYAVAERAPDRLRRVVTLALPHGRTFLARLRIPAQLRASWYMLAFQLPGSTWATRAFELALIDRLWRAWSPGFALDPARRAALHDCLAQSLPAPLEYYRAMPRTAPRMVLESRHAGPITVPVLQLHGADDGCVLPPGDADGHLFVQRVYECVPNVGHFLHLEAPTVIADRVLSWLR